ncbi:hypothetical protein QQ045_023878 [Rhodiola kirilowii]
MNGLWQFSQETKKLVWILCLGQVVSLILALGNLCSSLIANLGVDAPLSQALFVYVLLAVVCGGIMMYRRQRLLVSWYWYLLLGFVDVQGNYLFNTAYQYSSITSVALLDCWTIAWAIGLTWMFLGTRYSLWQMFGTAISTLGLGLVLFSDAGVGGGGGSRPLLGDTLVIVATLSFAVSNVSQEFFVKKKDLVEVLAMLGLFGALVSICEICIFEIKSLQSIVWSTNIILSACGFTLAIFLFYIFLPLTLKLSGATFVNLSLLTSDMWAVIFRICFYHQKVDWLYYLSFTTVAVGLVIYSKTGKDSDPVVVTSLHLLNPEHEDEVVNDESGENGTEYTLL